MRFIGGTGSYPVAILASCSLHLIMLLLLTHNWNMAEPQRRVIKPQYIDAKLLTLEAPLIQDKPKDKPAEKPKPKVDDSAQKLKQEQLKQEQLKQEQRRKAEQQKQKQQALQRQKEQAEKLKREQQAKEKEQQRKQEEARKAAEAKRQQQLAEALKQEQQLQEDQQVTQSYGAYMEDRIASNWSRPASAKRDMEVLLEIRLTPNGQVVGVRVLKSSGDAAMDRSAEQAVLKVERFDRLREMDPAVFERHFRKLTLLFRPDDLRL